MSPQAVVTRRYPKSVRDEILNWAREGKNWSQRARELGIRHQSAYYWVSSAHKKFLTKSKPRREKTKSRPPQSQVNPKVMEFVCNLYEANPKITLAQICKQLQNEMAVTVAQSTAHKYLRGMVFTRSKYPPPDYSSLECRKCPFMNQTDFPCSCHYSFINFLINSLSTYCRILCTINMRYL